MERQIAQRRVPRSWRRAELERRGNARAIGRARSEAHGCIEVHRCDDNRAFVHGWREHSNLQGWHCVERQVA